MTEPRRTPPAVTRETQARLAHAVCTTCGRVETSGWALAWAANHTRRTGHTVRGQSHAHYLYTATPATVTVVDQVSP